LEARSSITTPNVSHSQRKREGILMRKDQETGAAAPAPASISAIASLHRSQIVG
jgi:hypothetical protein